MSFLLDTNVISELAKAQPEPKVVAWLADADESRTFISVLTVAELSYGIERLPKGRRRERFARWLELDLIARFESRILGLNLAVAFAWGSIAARSRSLGIGIGVVDGFLAATASVQGLVLVTRNVKDFQRLGIPLLNP